FGVTASIVLGSVPAVLIGSFLSSRGPGRHIRPIITFVIFASGLKYIGVGTTALGWILCAVALGGGCYWLARTQPWTNGRLGTAPAAGRGGDGFPARRRLPTRHRSPGRRRLAGQRGFPGRRRFRGRCGFAGRPARQPARPLTGPGRGRPHGHGRRVGTAAAVTAAAKSSGRSSGVKCPAPSRWTSRASVKNSPSRSDHWRGNSGSCSGHSTVTGTVIRSAGPGTCSATEVATEPAPDRYQATDEAKAPGRAYIETRCSRC